MIILMVKHWKSVCLQLLLVLGGGLSVSSRLSSRLSSLLGILLSLLGGISGLLHLALLLVLLGLLSIREGLELLLGSLGGVDGISDEEIVKNATGLNLPDVDSDKGEVSILSDGVVIYVLRVSDLLGCPDSLVGGVGDPLDLPLALELRVVDLRGLPGAVGLVIPVIWLGGLRVRDLGRNVVMTVGLLVLRVIHLGIIDPVSGLLLLSVIGLLGLEELPSLSKLAVLDLG